jgi:hypothetical protein
LDLRGLALGFWSSGLSTGDWPEFGGIVGAQEPTVCTVPDYVKSAGQEAIELAESAGLILDAWQRGVLEKSLGYGKDGRWAAFEVGMSVPRQNGKGAILEARELAALFVLPDVLTVHSAHQFDTSLAPSVSRA